MFDNEIERIYGEKLIAIFALVSAQKPEKGVRALLKRAKILAVSASIPLEEALERIYQEAVERTERRLALLSQCSIEKSRDLGSLQIDETVYPIMGRV